MQENFGAWNLRHEDFDALPPESRVAFLVGFAVLAPSSHNSQPWKFAVGKDDIVVSADMSRALPQSDANHRQMYTSIGCAIENLVIAADYYGCRATVESGNDDGGPAWRVVISGEPVPAASRRADHPATFIAVRVTNRGKYEARPPEAAFLEWMRGLATPDTEVRVIETNPLKDQVVDIVSDALIEAMDDNGFRTELSGYIRPNITKATTGMPMYGFGMPTPPSFIAPTLVRFVNVNRLSRKEDESLLRQHTPALVVLSMRADGVEDWVEAGRLYERIAIEAVGRGMSTAPMAASIQIGRNFERLQKTLGTGFRPQVFFRLGYAATVPPHSPRIPSAKVISIT